MFITIFTTNSSKKFTVGIDVGGQKRGFHCAKLDVSKNKIVELFKNTRVEDVANWLEDFSKQTTVVAIDSPPKAVINGPETRLAERQLHKAGFRVQWTRRKSTQSQEWMLNGEKLWHALDTRFKEIELIETFPTAAYKNSINSKTTLHFNLFGDDFNKKDVGDFMDACICADVAKRYLHGGAKLYGLKDELGPIYV